MMIISNLNFSNYNCKSFLADDFFKISMHLIQNSSEWFLIVIKMFAVLTVTTIFKSLLVYLINPLSCISYHI